MNFYSHPDVLLIDHLTKVRNNMKKGLVDLYPERVEAYCLMGACHDFGKYTTFFQDKLLNKKAGNNLSQHALISAIFTYHISLHKYNDIQFALYAHNIVKCHHTAMKNLGHRLPQGKGDINYFHKMGDGNILIQQMDNLRSNKETIIKDFQRLGLEKETETFFEVDLKNLLLEISKQIRTSRSEISGPDYILFQYLYSLLIASDKYIASETNVIETRTYPIKSIEERRNQILSQKEKLTIRKLTENEMILNDMRKKIFDGVMDSIQENGEKNKIFSITAPTGSGKTFTGFFAAKHLQEMSKKGTKIFYILPYTSIIDQNYEIIKDLITVDSDFQKNEGTYLIKHHYLQEQNYKMSEEEFNESQQSLLVENWQSGIVVSTFVQLIHSVFGVSNKMLKKLHNYHHSVILLDEIQAIDIKYLPLVEAILRYLVEALDCKVILMTATRPIILTEAFELLEQYEAYFEQLERTKLIYNTDSMTINQFVEFFFELFDYQHNCLIVLNTIKQSIQIYEKIKAELKARLNEDSITLLYLSANIIPRARREIISKAKELMECGKKVLLVSTQVIEAGVDLDFDLVIRDIAPLDSIIQCAGRCNRNYKQRNMPVYIVKIVDDFNKTFGAKVYGNLGIIYDLFEKKQIFLESEYLNLINDYFQLVDQAKSKEEANHYIDCMYNLRFQPTDEKLAISDFTLIKNQNKSNVFILIDDAAENLFDTLKKLLFVDNHTYETKLDIRKINKQLSDYSIAINSYYLDRIQKLQISETYAVYYIDRDSLHHFYDEITGFKLELEAEDRFY